MTFAGPLPKGAWRAFFALIRDYGRQSTVFDPFNDRTSRDIRNSLSRAFVAELTGASGQRIDDVAQAWLGRLSDPMYRRYIRHRVKRYRQLIQAAAPSGDTDPRYLARWLWNAGLFFELHELLETFWKEARGEDRIAVKGLIQAAGVYVHRQQRNWRAAEGLAARARKNLQAGSGALDFLSGVDALIKALGDPRVPPPKLG